MDYEGQVCVRLPDEEYEHGDLEELAKMIDRTWETLEMFRRGALCRMVIWPPATSQDDQNP